MPYAVPAWALRTIGINTMRLPRKMVRMACHQFIPSPISEEASMYVGMQADMEIHNAAKLPTRHFRRSAGTGARSALKSGLACSSFNCSAVSPAWVEFMCLHYFPRKFAENQGASRRLHNPELRCNCPEAFMSDLKSP